MFLPLPLLWTFLLLHFGAEAAKPKSDGLPDPDLGGDDEDVVGKSALEDVPDPDLYGDDDSDLMERAGGKASGFGLLTTYGGSQYFLSSKQMIKTEAESSCKRFGQKKGKIMQLVLLEESQEAEAIQKALTAKSAGDVWSKAILVTYEGIQKLVMVGPSGKKYQTVTPQQRRKRQIDYDPDPDPPGTLPDEYGRAGAPPDPPGTLPDEYASAPSDPPGTLPDDVDADFPLPIHETLFPWLQVEGRGDDKNGAVCVPECGKIDCTIITPECTSKPTECTITQSSQCKFVPSANCTASCEVCELVQPQCVVKQKQCQVKQERTCELMAPNCEVNTPTCTVTRKSCQTILPKCDIVQKETECEPGDTATVCREKVIVCPTPQAVCTPETIKCGSPIVKCDTPTIKCTEPEIACDTPEIVCTKPSVHCTAPVLTCPVVIATCPHPKLHCPGPDVLCPPPTVNCTAIGKCKPSTPFLTECVEHCEEPSCKCTKLAKANKYEWVPIKCTEKALVLCEEVPVNKRK